MYRHCYPYEPMKVVSDRILKRYGREPIGKIGIVRFAHIFKKIGIAVPTIPTVRDPENTPLSLNDEIYTYIEDCKVDT